MTFVRFSLVNKSCMLRVSCYRIVETLTDLPMKKAIITLIALVGLAFGAQAADVTLKGTGTCAKCGLGESGGCQNVVQVKKDGKTVTYYMEKNEVAKKFHKNVCSGTTPVTVKGTVTKKGKKMVVTAKSITKS